MTTYGIPVIAAQTIFGKMVPLCHELYLIIAFNLSFQNMPLMTKWYHFDKYNIIITNKKCV